MSARDDILRTIRARKAPALPRPARYRRVLDDDLAERFATRARAADATVEVLESMADVSGAVAGLLRARNMAACIHLPPGSAVAGLDWGQVRVLQTPPGPEDVAVALAPLGIGETGTLVFPAGEAAPASWHFRPGFEIAVLRVSDIVPDLETALSSLRMQWPHTINLVTGPSRTADIEQTLELGAHGPKALAVLLVRV
ncbi:MAG TPA: LUD domain-containing protein [Rhizomicrobium sp.]|nr:LUD domain-containing protein [Rhizomicrobium sp.]